MGTFAMVLPALSAMLPAFHVEVLAFSLAEAEAEAGLGRTVP